MTQEHSVREGGRDWGVIIPPFLDDYGLDPYEMRVYIRLARRAGMGGQCWESITNMATNCKMSQQKIKNCLALLNTAGLITQIKRPGKSDLYELMPQQKWVKPNELDSLRTQVNAYRVASDQKFLTDRKENNTQLHSSYPPSYTVATTQLHSSYEDIPVRISQEDIPLLSLTAQEEREENQEKFSVKNEKEISLPDNVTNKIEDSPLGQSTSNSYRDRTRERFNRTAEKLEWEISPGKPYPVFVKWRSAHYVKQGGHWADAALANARSEIRNNPLRAEDLWQQFLEYSNTAADGALAAKQAGIIPSLPPCFVNTSPVVKDEVMAKIDALTVPVTALPTQVASQKSQVTSEESGLASSTEYTNLRNCDLRLVTSDLVDGDYQAQEENIRRLGEMIQKIKSIPRSQRSRSLSPANQFEKMRSWLRSEDPALHSEAIAWVSKREDVTPEFDEYGNILDFQIIAS